MKVIVAHPGRQHSFQSATALKRAGVLYKYITTVYYRQGSLTYLLGKITKGDILKKVKGRRCTELNDEDVVQFNELFVVGTLVLNRIPGFSKFTERWNKAVESSFYKKVMKYARKHKVDAIIVYNGYAKKYFELLDGSGVIKIIDVSIAQREYVRDILDAEIKTSHIPDIRDEHFSYWNDRMIKDDVDGCKMADYFFVPSEFVYNSLVTHEIKPEQILKVPYGVDVNKFQCVSQKSKDGPLNLIYVGGISYRKGLHRLLYEMEKFDKKEVRLTLAGSYDPMSKLYQKYKDAENIDFLGFVTRDRLAEVYNKSHVFILPSFAEGMAMVGLEALACGLPLVCTSYTGVNDVINEGVNGFVYDAYDSERLHEIIKWFISNREKIATMGQAARETAMRYTWEHYYRNYYAALRQVVNNGGRDNVQKVVI